MARPGFHQLVATVEQRWGQRPFGLRVQCALWLLLGLVILVINVGFLPLLGIGLLAVGIFAPLKGGAGLIFAAFGAVALVLGVITAVRVLWQRLDLGPATTITEHDAPTLFTAIERVRSQLGARRFHEVRIDSRFNASVTDVPRLGLIGLSRHYLTLGLPLMQALSSEQCLAVIAHECGHLSARHGRFTATIYRLRRMWQRMVEVFNEGDDLAKQSLYRRMMRGFVNWWWPRFDALAFVLSRAQEYEADADAARCCGTQPMADALKQLDIHHPRINAEFWKPLWQHLNPTPDLPGDVIPRLMNLIATPADDSASARFLAEALRARAATDDTHPSLAQRLRALGDPMPESLPAQGSQSAAQALLGDALPMLVQAAQRNWEQEFKGAWKQRHDHVVATQRQLDAFQQAQAKRASTDVDDLWRNAGAIADLQGPEAAAPHWQRVLELQPTHAAAAFNLGLQRLEKDDPSGLALIEQAIQRSSGFTVGGCRAMLDYHARHGQLTEQHAMERRLDQHDLAESRGAVVKLRKGAMTLGPHGLDSAVLAEVQLCLREHSPIQRAWLALQPAGDQAPITYVLAIDTGRSRWQRQPSERERRIIRTLSHELKLPARSIIFARNPERRALWKELTARDDALIMER